MERRPWPDDIDRLVDTGAEVDGRGPDCWRVGRHLVTRLWSGPDRADLLSVDGFVGLLARLCDAAPFAVPRVVATEGPWVVTEHPPGMRADRPDLHPEPGALAGLIGSGLAALHALPPSLLTGEPQPADGSQTVDDSGTVDGWALIVDRCCHSVADGRVDGAELPPPYDRYEPERLLELLIEAGTRAGPARPPVPDDPPVLCHGAATAGWFLTDGGRFVGFDGFECAVVADRHLDLAAAHLSVARVLGAEAVFGLYEGYGLDPDLARLDRAVLAVHLLCLTGIGMGSP